MLYVFSVSYSLSQSRVYSYILALNLSLKLCSYNFCKIQNICFIRQTYFLSCLFIFLFVYCLFPSFNCLGIDFLFVIYVNLHLSTINNNKNQPIDWLRPCFKSGNFVILIFVLWSQEGVQQRVQRRLRGQVQLRLPALRLQHQVRGPYVGILLAMHDFSPPPLPLPPPLFALFQESPPPRKSGFLRIIFVKK